MGFAKPRNRNKPKTDPNEKFIAEVKYIAKRLNRDPLWVAGFVADGNIAGLFREAYS